MEDAPTLSPSRAVLRGLLRRCPLCGGRGIFTSWFRQPERCPRCNYPTNRVEDQWIGSLGMNIIVSFTLLVFILAIGFIVTYPKPPVVTLLAITVPFAALFPVFFFPISRSLWSGIDLAMRAPVPEDDVDPRYLPSTRHIER